MGRQFVIKRNDLSPGLKGYLKTRIDVTLDTAVLLMRNRKTNQLKLDRVPVTLGEDSGGRFFTYDWVEGDTDTAGQFHIEVEALQTNGKPITFPNRTFGEVLITEDLG